MHRDARGGLGDLGVADRVADVLAVQRHGRAVEADLEPARELADRVGVVDVDPGAARRQRDAAVHRAGVEVREAERVGDAAGDG